jgi:hypothetical protein
MKSFARRALRRSRRAARTVSTRLGWHARPDFLILGAQKAGTSALHSYLLSHPKIAAPSAKELYYFSPESFRVWPDFPGSERYSWFARGHRDASVRRETLRWYHAQFPVPIPLSRRLCHEATTCYLFFPEVARRIHEYRPDMKLIVLLRDPVERAFSAWNMLRGFTFEPWNQMLDSRSFDEAVRDEAEGRDNDPANPSRQYLSRGIYHEQLRRYFALFPREQILVIDQAELLANRLATVNAACRFLGLEPIDREEAWPLVNVGTYESDLSREAREYLAEFYAPHNDALFELIGRQFAWERPAATRTLARAAG